MLILSEITYSVSEINLKIAFIISETNPQCQFVLDDRRPVKRAHMNQNAQ